MERPGPQIGKRQMPGQRESKREIKLIKSLVKINSTSVNLAAEIHPVVWKRALRIAVTLMMKKKSHSWANSAAGFSTVDIHT